MIYWQKKKATEKKKQHYIFCCVGSGTVDSDGCQVRRRFFNQKTIPGLTLRILSGFTVNCTTQAVYKVGYSDGRICQCGEYSVNDAGSQISVTCTSFKFKPTNFIVEISVENVRNPEGERCTFSFRYFAVGSTPNFDVRILPENVFASAQPLPTTSEVLTSSTTHESPTGKLNAFCLFNFWENRT